jgi:membrane protein implicated in regulation of membrane protease activity
MIASIPWWAWAIFAAVVAFSELQAPGIYLIWIGLGAGLTAAAAAVWPLHIEYQLEIFAAASCLSCIVGYFVYRRSSSSAGSSLNQRDRQMVGARGTVAIPLANGRGKVRLGDTVWLAEGPDLAAGTPVVVKAVRGSRVVVEQTGADGA